MKITLLCFAITGYSTLLSAQAPSTDRNPLLRQYRAGETLVYRMKGVNEAWHYQIQADRVVKKDAAGPFCEEYQWSNLISDNQAAILSSATLAVPPAAFT